MCLYISATRRGVSLRPSLFGSSPIACKMIFIASSILELSIVVLFYAYGLVFNFTIGKYFFKIIAGE